jgi:hypothetical protein
MTPGQGIMSDRSPFSDKRKGTLVPLLSPLGEDLVIVVRYFNNLFGGEGGIAGLRPLTASRFALRRLTLLVEPVNWIHLGFESLLSNSHAAMLQGLFLFGGEGGIRTLDTLLTYTHFPGVLLQPLGHFS